MKGFRNFLRLVVSILFMVASLSIYAADSCKGYLSPGNPYECGPYGNCVWWAMYKRPDLKGVMTRSAKFWYQDAVTARFSVGSKPKTQAVVVFNQTVGNEFGHVAYVENVNSDGSFSVSEMDFTGSFGNGMVTATYHPVSGGYRRNDGTTIMPILGFIYKTCDFTKERCDIRVSGSIGWYPPISDCSQASQWFIIGTVNGERIPIGTASAANCPLVCVAPNQ